MENSDFYEARVMGCMQVGAVSEAQVWATLCHAAVLSEGQRPTITSNPWPVATYHVPHPLPHSRACGIREHNHGELCSNDCPTCGGSASGINGSDPGGRRL